MKVSFGGTECEEACGLLKGGDGCGKKASLRGNYLHLN